MNMNEYDPNPLVDKRTDELAQAFLGVVQTGLKEALDWVPDARAVPPELAARPAPGHPAFKPGAEFRPAGQMAVASQRTLL